MHVTKKNTISRELVKSVAYTINENFSKDVYNTYYWKNNATKMYLT